MRFRSLLLILAGATAAQADPVASTTAVPPAGSEHPVPVAEETAPRAEDLAAAPDADQASGIAVPAPRENHRIANAILAIPRATVLLLLEGPRYAAAEVDDYLERKSPNAFARDVKKTAAWRFGATLEYQTELGTSIAARVGRRFTNATSVDGYAGAFGARGQSGGVHAALGRYTELKLEPTLSLDVGRDLTRAFAGVGEHGPRATYDQQGVTAAGGVLAHAGDFQFGARASYDNTRTDDPSTRFLEVYDPMTIIGFEEIVEAGTGELSVAYDTRRPGYRWIRRAAPSTGFYVRAAAAYTSGNASRTRDFAFGRGTLEARRLFDLFHGDRVLSIGAALEAVTDDEIPFDRLPSLGGRDRMRAFAQSELRDRAATYADVQYDWPLGSDCRAYLFLEGGAAGTLRAGYGGGIRWLSGSATSARIQVAGSDTGDAGVFFQLGAL